MGVCAHCSKESGLDGRRHSNHVRWCSQNPNRTTTYATKRPQVAELMKQKHAEGKFSYKPLSTVHKEHLRALWTDERREKERALWTDERREKTRQHQMSLKHRRVMRHSRPYVKHDGSIVILDSSWEEALAKRLDELSVSWERPEPIQWIDLAGRTRNYFPDFYLPQQQLYLDPKNYGARLVQKEKLLWLQANRNDVIILHTLEECKVFTPP